MDHEVRKNFVIAVMARAARKMAESSAARRYNDADRFLVRALDFYRRHYPTTTDEDLVQTRQMLQRYREVLCQHIERFRDL